MYSAEPVTVAVPATSANLGPGFDSLGLALGLFDHVTAQVIASGDAVAGGAVAGAQDAAGAGDAAAGAGGAAIRVEVTGEGAGEVPADGTHLIISTMWRTFAELDLRPPDGLALTCQNRIPHARGLGSSSAAIVAGILLARALAGQPREDAWSLRLAARIEGHPDNVAPCLLGGFTIAWTDNHEARAVRLVPHPDLRPSVYVPTTRGLTAHARAALPERVPHADAAFNAARAALLVHALTSAPDLLLVATEDRLHQPYRASGMPETAALVARLRDAGVPAFVSGAGPTVLALPVSTAPEAPEGWRCEPLSVDLDGGRILSSGHAEGDPVAAGLPS